MSSLFRSPQFTDPLLGDLRRKRGVWRGTIGLGDAEVPLAVPGPRSAPDPRAIDVARAAPSSYPHWRPTIAAALFDHYEPNASAARSDDLDPARNHAPRVGRPDEVWPHVRIAFVAVRVLGGERFVEIGYDVAWDDEHTLGARLRDGRLIELNGSVLRP